jgi:hypothetical protein
MQVQTKNLHPKLNLENWMLSPSQIFREFINIRVVFDFDFKTGHSNAVDVHPRIDRIRPKLFDTDRNTSHLTLLDDRSQPI